MPVISFYIPWKHQKRAGFLTFSGSLDGEQWYQIGDFGLARYEKLVFVRYEKLVFESTVQIFCIRVEFLGTKSHA